MPSLARRRVTLADHSDEKDRVDAAFSSCHDPHQTYAHVASNPRSAAIHRQATLTQRLRQSELKDNGGKLLNIRIDRGNEFHQKVMELDRTKSSLFKEQVEKRLTSLFAEFIAQAELAFAVSAKFCDVHAIMGRVHHTELSYVRLSGLQCEFLFHHRLLSVTDPNEGLVFPAKCWILLLILHRAIELAGQLKKDFVFEIGDSGGSDQVAFNSTNPAACLIVDPQFIGSHGYRDFRQYCEHAIKAWDTRSPKVFWRGSTTGTRMYEPPVLDQDDDLAWLPRLTLCKKANSEPMRNYCDVRISAIVQIGQEHLKKRIEAAGVVGGPVPRETFMQFQKVFDIDGNGNAWSGLFLSLLGASCVLKVASQKGFRQWYYDRLIPWRNYVPIASDFADFDDVVRWCANNDRKCREIAAEGRDLALSLDLTSSITESAANFVRFCRPG